MTSPPPSPMARVPGYELGALTDADARAMLLRVFGAERAESLWTEACRVAGVATTAIETPELLLRVSQALAMNGGAVAVVSRSIDIRLRTYAALIARRAAPGRSA